MFRYLKSRLLHTNTIIIVATLGVFGIGVLVLWFAFLDLPDLRGFEERIVEQSTKIYDRTGEVLLYDVYENIQRTVVPYENISRHVKNATVAIEDSEFYEHGGIRITSTLRAILTNILNLDPLGGQGGSTITQQVVKNSLLTPKKQISRKLKEWALALKLEQVRSKEEILTLYLNETPYGGNIYGVEEASQSFFGKSAQDITIAEAAYLAALPQAPTYYSPYGDNLDDLEKRKDFVLQRMLEEGFLSDEEFVTASNEEITFTPRQEQGIRAPHFVFFVQKYLEQKYGPRVLYEEGLRVITTLDWNLQEIGERVVKEYALQNKERFNAENAALVAVNPRTGEILAMVGSRDYFDESIDGNFNVTLAHRQPGSAFKPIVYAAALEKGYTPETVVFDLQTQFSTICNPTNLSRENPCYSPINYDNIFRGPVTFREALAQSINVPSVKVLYLVGLQDALNMARRVGIQGLGDANQYGLTLVLGGGEVTPLEMAGAYGTFANDGVWNESVGIARIENISGNVLEEIEPNPQQVMPKNVAYQISNILSDNTARAPAFGEDSFLNFPVRDVAVKTGTTNDYRDAWIIGYTPSLSVAAWAGNNDNSPMVKKVAGFIIAPLWRAFMDEALAQVPNERFVNPLPASSDIPPRLRGVWQGGETYLVDSMSGKLATEFTPPETQEEEIIENVHSILHWVSKEHPLQGALDNPAQDPQYTYWEVPIAAWAAQRGYFSGPNTVARENIPIEKDDIHTLKNLPSVSVSGIKEDKTYSINDVVALDVTSKGKFPLNSIEVYLNNQYVTTDKSKPFSIMIDLENAVVGKKNTLRVVGVDSAYNRSEVVFKFLVLKE